MWLGMVDVRFVCLNQTDGEQYAEQLKNHDDGEQSTSRGGDRDRKQLQLNGDNSGSLGGRISEREHVIYN